MKVLGVVPSSTDLKLALVDGDRSAPILLPFSQKTQKLPAAVDEGLGLQSLYRWLATLLREQGAQKVCILQAGNSRFGGPSAERVKTEGIIQLVGADLSIATELIPPQTLRAQEKRFAGETHGSPEAIFNQGAEFVPKPWRDAVLVAWVGLSK